MKVDLNDKAYKGIVDFCANRPWNTDHPCNGCPYAITNVVEDPGNAECIFANCPRDWSHYYEGKKWNFEK